MDARMRRDAGDGFTLIELTNLILIAGILIPIAVPTYPGDEDATRSSDAGQPPHRARGGYDVPGRDRHLHWL